MAVKINMWEKGKTWKLELEGGALFGKSLSEVVPGKMIKSELDGYEFKITGGSDFAGFPLTEEIEGIGLKRSLLKQGDLGFTGKAKGGRLSKGVRRRKTLRGKTIAETTAQVNMIVVKSGSKKFEEIFPEQNQPKVKAEEKKVEEKPAEGS